MSTKSNSMLLFLGELPSHVTNKELRDFVGTTIKEVDDRLIRLFSPITSCNIMRVTDPLTGLSRYNAMVEVSPARLALKAVDRLNGRLMHGSRIEARRFRHCSFVSTHSRRTATMADMTGTDAERAPLKLEMVCATQIGDEAFNGQGIFAH